MIFMIWHKVYHKTKKLSIMKTILKFTKIFKHSRIYCYLSLNQKNCHEKNCQQKTSINLEMAKTWTRVLIN